MKKDTIKLEQAITNRNLNRYLHVDTARLRYANQYLLGPVIDAHQRNALYVGVGHGHDALLALLDGQVQSVVGVDPFMEGGNSDDDYHALLNLISAYEFDNQFKVVRSGIRTYLNNNPNHFEMIVINDVLHHIFITPEPLIKSTLFAETVKLFEQLAEVAAAGAVLIVSDVQRHGLRPLLSKRKLVDASINYKTKQSWKEWHAAAHAAQWHLYSRTNYVPYAFRKTKWLWSGPWGLYTLCPKYFLHYHLANTT